MQRPPTLAALACAAALLLTACGGNDKDTESPTTPAGVTAQAGSATSVHVMWDQATDNKAVTGYEVFQKGAKVKAVPATKSMVDIDRLSPKTAYSFTVRARDAAGNLSKPSPATAVTTPATTPEDKQAPARPAELRGKVDGGRTVTLSWGKAADNIGITSYDIYQEDSRIHSVSGTETTARVTGLRPGTVYTFTVRARDAAENSSPDSNSVDLTTASAPGNDAPSTAPTDLKATARKGNVDLSWTPPRTGGPVKEHQLFLNGKLATTIVWGAAPPAGTATYTIMITDKPGTRYSIKLRAKLPDGKWGDFSAQRTVVVR
ncbi:fibronectin type III domain-containing protein [Streptomyces lunaelactis]|uniref:fibronectin type III domain-containing protein n=1 Tax=Streptomyces lunaelactis TaxID=1535768 RepID=UPI001584B7B2|nr:fibronectin type III domain-containing protein [Streptomyces lunaelactis]NUK03977.1 fibronectin type III domain-containing protein [Streptomyces lunaelactis]NUK10298.1 fibronectin type III domain-containing protein [Streptomyces lunaelactis]NUK18483.1 fibronectin type III domain-containing protein [Streptomyces lunaelactis]NUK36976.1 fibronectin type III domain-containing protein [Streptomyces lunaelactis]NUK44833.1 fibronectin type III domain-containing protein [Streptomyces lunaelactis]